jgi:hypothetical protein
MLTLNDFKIFEPKIFTKDEMYQLVGGKGWSTTYTSHNTNGVQTGSGTDTGSDHSTKNNTTGLTGEMKDATWDDSWV